jgi:hypothetical protein
VNTPAPSNQPIRYLALGDSYTIGESVPENERWSNQLAGLFETSSPTWGRMGDSSHHHRPHRLDNRRTLARDSGAAGQPPYDMVSLLIGVNNQYRGYDINEYREEFRFLLGKPSNMRGECGSRFRRVHSRLGRHAVCRRQGRGKDRAGN